MHTSPRRHWPSFVVFAAVHTHLLPGYCCSEPAYVLVAGGKPTAGPSHASKQRMQRGYRRLGSRGGWAYRVHSGMFCDPDRGWTGAGISTRVPSKGASAFRPMDAMVADYTKARGGRVGRTSERDALGSVPGTDRCETLQPPR